MLRPPKLLPSTSTPITKRYNKTDDSDSGYLSYSSHDCTSFDSSSPYTLTVFDKEYVDFLHNLGEKSNYTLIVERIAEYLNDEDLHSAAAVSKTWKKVILSIPAQRKRYRNYARKIELMKENKLVNSDYNSCEERRTPISRSTLAEIQNKSLLNSNSPLSSASTPTQSCNFRFEAYQMEAQRLKVGKRLFSCPKCKLPSHVDEKELQTAVCTNSCCQYRFCILCHCGVHRSRICNFISTPVVRIQVSLVGTKNFKRNLKRLLL